MDIIDSKSLLTKLSELSTIASLFVGGGVSYYIVKNHVPKIRIGRAFSLAIRSLLRSPKIKSVRKEDIKNVLREISEMKGEEYYVVRGPKGVGKTCMIQSALKRRIGVIHSKNIFPGISGDEIIKNAYKDISGNNFSWIDSEILAKNVIWWYTFLFRSRPIYVINALERQSGEPFAQIPPAARILASEGLRVIVDCSDNAIEAKRLRQINYEVGPMNNEMISSIPEYAALIKFAKKHELIDCILLFCDGNPSEMNNIVREYNSGIKISEEKTINLIEGFILIKIESAVDQYDKLIMKYPDIGAKLDEIRTNENLQLEKLSFNRKFDKIPDFKNILRESKKIKETVYIPATPTMGFILKEGIKSKVDSFKDIKEKVAIMNLPKKNEIKDNLKKVEQEKNIKV